MRRVLLIFLLASLLATSACTVDGGGEGTTPTSSSVTSTLMDAPPTTATSVPPETTTTTTASVGDPGALITNSGVVVAVRAKTTAGFIITTPCGNLGYATGGEPIGEIAVVLDPGHGGPIDTGAMGRNGLIERDVNLAVALATQAALAERGIEALLTRTADYATPLFVRAGLADSVNARILVSIHHNAPTPQSSDQPGTEIFIQTGNTDSRRLGGVLYESIVSALAEFDDVAWHAAPDAGVLMVHRTSGDDGYGMIRMPDTTSVLVELAYISNPAEAELLATDAYVSTASVALADGIGAYLTGDAPGSGFVDEPRVFNPTPGVGPEVCEEVPLG